MTLLLPGVDMRVSTENLSQWFTPSWLANRISGLAYDLGYLQRRMTVLEPSCGNGALVEAVIGAEPNLGSLVGLDIDPACVGRVQARFPEADVREEDFLHHEGRYDLVVMNPPYENGMDGKFLEHAMSCSDRIVALIRTVALNGADRHARVWSRIGSREWTMRAIRFLANRPEFIAGEHVGADRQKYGAQADFVVVALERTDDFPRMGQTLDIGWW